MFTLLELIIAVVILAVLATIAIPTFAHDIAASSVQRDATSLTSAANDVRSIATSEGIPPSVAPSNADVAAGLNEVSIATGPLEGTAATAPSDVSTGYGNVSYDIAGDQVGYAMLTSNGDCTMALTTGNTTASWSYDSAIGDCDGVDALTGPGLASTPSSGGSGSGGSGGGDSSGTAPTAAPTGVILSQAPSAVTVTWTDVPSGDAGGNTITGYTAVATSTTAATQSCTSTSTICTISGLVAGATYQVTVVATNVVGNSPASAPQSITLTSAPTAAPTNVAVTESDGTATVTWTAVPSADQGSSPITSYVVTSVQDSTLGTTTASGTDTSAAVTDLTPGDNYSFTVTAVSTDGSGPASSASNTITADGPPPAPTGATATQSNATTITAAWTAPSDNGSPITGYITQYSSDGGNTWTTFILPPGNTSTTQNIVGEFTSGDSYIVEVAAINADGDGGWSAPSSSVTLASAPGVPTAVTASVASTTSALVSWTAPASTGGAPITGYTVTSSPGGETCTSTGATSCTVTGLTDGTTYNFTVTATNLAGTSGASTAGPILTAADITLPASTGWDAIAYGGGEFVTVSNDAADAAVSTNGTSWLTVPLPANDDWRSVTYGDGEFVAISTSAAEVAISPNGTTWTLEALPANDTWYSVTYGNGVFVGVSDEDAEAVYSTNGGTTWALATMPENGQWSSVTYGDGEFLAVGFDGYADMSTNGSTWTFENPGITEQTNNVSFYDVSFIDGEFVGTASGGRYDAVSTAGTTWTNGQMPDVASWSSVAYGAGEFIAVSDSAAAYSTNAMTWTSAGSTGSPGYGQAAIIYADGEFVSVGSSGAEILTFGLDVD
jgi:type II secretory pathway pseudopilin PulG/predicted RNA-binding protein with TRAM domain